VTALAHADADFTDRLQRVFGRESPGGTAWLANVAAVGVRLRVEALLEDQGLRIERAQSRVACAGVQIAYADPSRLGVDRFLALLAARALGGDQLVVSFGSALTVDLLDAHGRHHGGLIGIAAAHARNALCERFPALDRGEGDAATAFARDTPDAIAAGAHRQAVGLVMAAWDDACATLGRPPRLLLGGGDAGAYAGDLGRRLAVEVQTHDALVLEGLRRYAASVGSG
jgi:type III pantothenate kinase